MFCVVLCVFTHVCVIVCLVVCVGFCFVCVSVLFMRVCDALFVVFLYSSCVVHLIHVAGKLCCSVCVICVVVCGVCCELCIMRDALCLMCVWLFCLWLASSE